MTKDVIIEVEFTKASDSNEICCSYCRLDLPDAFNLNRAL